MIVNPAIPHPAAVSDPFTLNDLRMHGSRAEEPSRNSALALSGLVLAVAVAIGAFIWLDPLRLRTPAEARPPAPTFVPSAEPARPTERQEIIAPLTPVPTMKSFEVDATAPLVQAPHVPNPAIQPRAARIKPASRNPMEVLQAGPKERTAPPALLTTPKERTAPSVLLIKPEKTDAPIAPKLEVETNNGPKPAAANDQTSVTE